MVSVLASVRWKLIARIAATDAKVVVDDLNTWRILDSSYYSRGVVISDGFIAVPCPFTLGVCLKGDRLLCAMRRCSINGVFRSVTARRRRKSALSRGTPGTPGTPAFHAGQCILSMGNSRKYHMRRGPTAFRAEISHLEFKRKEKEKK
jgi:hypothetical protein